FSFASPATTTTYPLSLHDALPIYANDVAIDPTVVVRKYAANVGNGSATTFNLSHGLGTQDLTVTIKRVSDGEVVFADVVLPPARSEEHTSELQSRENLVCRLLLET